MPHKIVAFYLPKEWIKDMEELVKHGKYGSKSDLVRKAVLDLLSKEYVKDSSKEESSYKTD